MIDEDTDTKTQQGEPAAPDGSERPVVTEWSLDALAGFLLAFAGDCPEHLRAPMREAAHRLRATEAERDRLVQRVEVLGSALRPFAAVAPKLGEHLADSACACIAVWTNQHAEPGSGSMRVDDVRRAARALASSEGRGSGEREPSDAEVVAWALTLGGWGVHRTARRAGGAETEGWTWYRVHVAGDQVGELYEVRGPAAVLPAPADAVREHYAVAHATPEAPHAL